MVEEVEEVQIILQLIINQIHLPMEQVIILKEIHQAIRRLRVEELTQEQINLLHLQMEQEIIKKEEQLTNQIMFLKGEVERLSSL